MNKQDRIQQQKEINHKIAERLGWEYLEGDYYDDTKNPWVFKVNINKWAEAVVEGYIDFCKEKG